MKIMKIKVLLLLINFIIVSYSIAQVTVTKDTIYISGGTFSGAENAGIL